ncbi:transposase [Rhodoferax sp. UBA5149]|uniref:transposase n=1 Tax=Rhodoferax sp. UBA5149 TaxID=1947379 RepID=UPI0025FBA87C|nr:transposase [Rhodoferax sp. UBA5149]
MIRIGALFMTKNQYSIEFQEQALSKARQRGTRSVRDVANDLNMAVGTLRKWISKSNRKDDVSKPGTQLPDDLPAQSWGPAQRLLALNQTHAMSQTQLHAWCREKGLFEHQLKAWGEAFCSATAPESRESRTALRELQVKHDGLQRELRRKEKALAEAAALLVLQKKFQALWEDEEK